MTWSHSGYFYISLTTGKVNLWSVLIIIKQVSTLEPGPYFPFVELYARHTIEPGPHLPVIELYARHTVEPGLHLPVVELYASNTLEPGPHLPVVELYTSNSLGESNIIKSLTFYFDYYYISGRLDWDQLDCARNKWPIQ